MNSAITSQPKKLQAVWQSPLGAVVIIACETGLCSVQICPSHEITECSLPEGSSESSRIIQDAIRWLELYFNHQKPAFSLPLCTEGTPFQQKIWQILQSIPYGQTRTYKQIADLYEEKTGKKTSPRAIGQACGKNLVWLIIPCHRVIGSSGKMTGYAGGIPVKKALLDLEQTGFMEHSA